MSRPTVSVTIAQWGKTDWTSRCVDALRRSDYDGTIEILVYDNASPEGPGAVAERDDVDVVLGEENIGFGPAHDHLAERATGRYVLICNNDLVVDPRCIARLVDVAEQRPGPCIVGPLYRDFTGHVLELGGFLGPGGTARQFGHRRPLARSFRAGTIHVDYASGACMLVDRDEFLALGGFDDRYAPAYYEDTDLCMRFHERGHDVLVASDAIAYHHEGTTSGTDTSSGFKRFQVRNKVRFEERWGPTLADRPQLSEDVILRRVLSGRVDPSPQLLLWVLPQLPRPDVASGERRIMRMIDELLLHGTDVVVFAQSTFDHERYGPALVERGVRWFGPPQQERLGSLEPDDEPHLGQILRRVRPDTIMISWPRTARGLIATARSVAPQTPVLVDAVDLHFIREERSAARGVEDDSLGKERELQLYRDVDGVLVASGTEITQLRAEMPDADVEMYMSPHGEPVPTDPSPVGRDELAFLGGFHHRPNLDAVEYWVDELGPAVADRVGRIIPLTVYGAAAFEHLHDLQAAHPDLLTVRGWVDDLADAFVKARVSVAPLRFGAGTKGKVAAAACHGVPIVTTSIGAEGLSDGLVSALRVSDTTAGLVDAIVELLDDAAWTEARQATEAAAEQDWQSQQAQGEAFARWVQRFATARIVEEPAVPRTRIDEALVFVVRAAHKARYLTRVARRRLSA